MEDSTGKYNANAADDVEPSRSCSDIDNQEEEYDEANRAGAAILPSSHNSNTDHNRISEGMMPSSSESPRLHSEVAHEGRADPMMT